MAAGEYVSVQSQADTEQADLATFVCLERGTITGDDKSVGRFAGVAKSEPGGLGHAGEKGFSARSPFRSFALTCTGRRSQPEPIQAGLDLSSYQDGRAQAGAIYTRLADGSMPCDDPWPAEQTKLFKQFWTKAWRPKLVRLGAAGWAGKLKRLMP